jgi:pyridoxal phosphate enzyme (YggS family)
VVLSERLAEIRGRMAAAESRSGRAAGSVRLLAVVKRQSDEAIREAISLGVTDLAENYVQEWRARVERFGEGLQWHLIGHLQSNKVGMVVNRAATIQTVDRLSLVAELDRRATAPQEVMLQVNLAGEAQKSGCSAAEAVTLLDALSASRWLRPVGLMSIPPFMEEAEATRPLHAGLRELRETLNRRELEAGRTACLRELSMGMSDDFEIAIEEGATMVRVGSALFGERSG